MPIKFSIDYKENFGYKITCKIGYEHYPPFDDKYKNLHCDSLWIKYLGITCDFYIEKLIELGATNNCTKQFPSIIFKSIEDANKAITDFYEPLLVAKILIA